MLWLDTTQALKCKRIADGAGVSENKCNEKNSINFYVGTLSIKGELSADFLT